MNGWTMQVELNITLKHPIGVVGLSSLKTLLSNNNNYKILDNKNDIYLLVESVIEYNYKIRIQKNGEIFLKNMINQSNINYNDNFIEKMTDFLNEFLIDIELQEDIEKDINYCFKGDLARSLFWRKYHELKSIGNKILRDYYIRTYTHNERLIYIKLEATA